MADTREMIIKLVVSGDGDSLEEKMGKTTDTKSGLKILNNILHPVKSAVKAVDSKLPGIAIFANYAFSYTKSAVLYGLNRNFRLKEDYQSELTVQNTLNVFGKFTSLGAAMGGGAIAGSGGGAVGAVVGAVVAGVGWGMNEIVSAVQRHDQQNLSLNETNTQSTFKRVRLGLIDGGRGTEN